MRLQALENALELFLCTLISSLGPFKIFKNGHDLIVLDNSIIEVVQMLEHIQNNSLKGVLFGFSALIIAVGISRQLGVRFVSALRINQAVVQFSRLLPVISIGIVLHKDIHLNIK